MGLHSDCVKRILKALIYIEDHVDDELTLELLAEAASYSPYHFHRVFQAVVGEPVHRYVRRLRLERAAGRLQYTDRTVTDIALDAYYETPSAFTKAFKQAMGRSPISYRTLYKEVNIMKKKIAALPPITPERMETIKPLPVLFARRLGNYADSSRMAWDALCAFIHQEHLEKTSLRYFSISHDDPCITSEEKLRFDACIEQPAGVKPTGEIALQMLKEGKYAIFTHKGAFDTMNDTFERIFLKWLPDAAESYDDARPVFCEHFHLDCIASAPEKLLTNIYIPITQFATPDTLKS